MAVGANLLILVVGTSTRHSSRFMTEGSVVEFIEVVSAVALRIVVVLSSIVVESDIRTFPSSAAEKRNF